MDLEIKIIRMLWNLVEKSDPYSLLRLSDNELVQQLISQTERVICLSTDQSKNLSRYIGTRTVLIRDMASSKVK